MFVTQSTVLTFNPFALLIARKGLSTRKTLKTFTNDICSALKFWPLIKQYN